MPKPGAASTARLGRPPATGSAETWRRILDLATVMSAEGVHDGAEARTEGVVLRPVAGGECG